jgi:hypothetical protein
MRTPMWRRRYRRIGTAFLVAMLAAVTVSASVAAREPKRPDLDSRGSGAELEQEATRSTDANTIDVLSARAYLYDDGTVAVVGEVLNTYASRRELVNVNVNFYNSGVFIGSLGSPVFLTQLGWGSTSPFLVYDDAPEGTGPGSTFIASVDNVGTFVAAPPGGALQIVPGPTSIVGDERHFTGTVHNVSSTEVQFVYAAVTTYDSAGDVIDTTYDVTTPFAIPGGGSASYDLVLFYDPAEPVARSSLTADGWSGIDVNVYHTAWSNYFNDIGVSSFRPDIVWNAEQGITTGCGAGLFCPTANVPRDQMASFLSRALDLSGAALDAFTDDEGNPHEPNINLVAREAIASGCGVNLYCPSALVKRDQMASFLSRALDLSGAAPNAFTDDNGNIHEVNINLVARDGIASGCGGTNYCPSSNVTRGQMAAFLHRAFD